MFGLWAIILISRLINFQINCMCKCVNPHLIVLHHLLQSASQHAAGHLIIPNLSQNAMGSEELGVPPFANQLPLPPDSKEGLQRASEGARQQSSEEAGVLAFFGLALRRGGPALLGVVWRGQDRDWTVWVTWYDARKLLRVDVHGFGSASQHLRESKRGLSYLTCF